tara:strand:+ start:693 stop:2129 length:1437 start_codon:yes stop_codon:yes gene_type:complete
VKFKKFILSLISVLLLTISIAKADEISEEFNKRIIEDSKFSAYHYTEERNDIGVFYDFAWDKKNQIIKIKRDQYNYPIVRFSLFNKIDILPGTIIKKFNDLDLSTIDDRKIKEIHKKNSTVIFTLIDNKKITIDSAAYKLSDIRLTEFYLDYINDIDTTNGTLNISFRAHFFNERPELNKYAKNLLEEDRMYYVSETLFNEQFPLPIGDDILWKNEYKADVDIRNTSEVMFSYDSGNVRTTVSDTGVGQFREEFDFKKFPFDTQKLLITIERMQSSEANPDLTYDKTSAVNFITPNIGPFIGLDNFKNNNILKEWTVISSNIMSKEIIEKNYYDPYLDKIFTKSNNGIDLILEVKRNSAHYFYKIIIPVFLILCVAWFVLWIPTDKLDARLTTSIVALLSLIAYNFVFADDIPKLDYLTALDKYVLMSYIFCCIPTFMSIGFSRFIVKNQRMVINLNRRLRTWLGLVYILLTIQIFQA